MDGGATLPRLLLRNAQRFGHRKAAMREKDLVIWQTYSWADSLTQIKAFALGLAALGFQRGDKLALIGDNRPRLYWALTAAQCLGGIPVPLYQDAIARGGLATMRGYRKTHDDEIRGAVISRLLCHAVVDMAQVGRDFALDFRTYFAPELERLEEHRADNLIAYESDDLCVTPLGRIFIRNVAMVFDPYLERQPVDKPLFSKTL